MDKARPFNNLIMPHFLNFIYSNWYAIFDPKSKIKWVYDSSFMCTLFFINFHLHKLCMMCITNKIFQIYEYCLNVWIIVCVEKYMGSYARCRNIWKISSIVET
jgi:hypothetical protein